MMSRHCRAFNHTLNPKHIITVILDIAGHMTRRTTMSAIPWVISESLSP